MSSTPIRKVVISEFGDVSKVNCVNSTIEPPKAGEVQVAPLYSVFSGSDINMRRGTYPMQKKAPLTPGYALSGIAKTNGTYIKAGDLVTSMTKYGAQAELANVEEKFLIRIPKGVSPEAAPAILLDWATAYGMVDRSAKVQKGQRVFIHGISGAVGFATMKLCLLRGAEVYGTASERNHQAIRDQGATPFVYTDKNWIKAMQGLGGVHAVFDALGPDSWEESYSILPPCAKGDERGILVGYGANQTAIDNTDVGSAGTLSQVIPVMKLFLKNVKVFSNRSTTFFCIAKDQATFVPDCETIFDLVQSGQIEIPIRNVWDMENIQEAHKNWGSGSGYGSNLISIPKNQYNSEF
ncbi:zinc-binding dehydrogenase [Xylariaceae sp. FL0255]|nr:zinc-binding dehydrogenase [Xylariaceae sp. FL0255]